MIKLWRPLSLAGMLTLLLQGTAFPVSSTSVTVKKNSTVYAGMGSTSGSSSGTLTLNAPTGYDITKSELTSGTLAIWNPDSLDTDPKNQHQYTVDVSLTAAGENNNVDMVVKGKLVPESGGNGGGGGSDIEFTGKVPHVDLDADTDDDGTSLDRTDAEDKTEDDGLGLIVPLNNNFDEGNTNANGEPVPDHEPDDDAGGHRAEATDNQLRTAKVAMTNRGADGPVTWSTPSQVLVWQSDASEQVKSGEDLSDTSLSNGGGDVLIEGVSAGKGSVQLTFAPKSGANNAGQTDDKINVTVVQVTDVAWKGVTAEDGDDNLETTSLHGGGMRIFPGKNSANGSTHDTVKCEIRLNRTIPDDRTVKIHAKVFDVDDPTHDTGPVDSNDSTDSDDNVLHEGGDNRGSSPGVSPTGVQTYTVSGTNTIQQEYTIDAMQPGNNVKILASVNKDLVKGAEVDPTEDNGTDGANSFRMASNTDAKPQKANQSPLLSVWRRFYYELDSMGPTTETGDSERLGEQELRDEDVNYVDDRFAKHGEPWRVDPDTASGETTWYEISGNHDSANNPGETIEVDLNIPNVDEYADVGDPYEVRYNGFDTDGDCADADDYDEDCDDERADPQAPDVGPIKDAFRPAYVVPKKASHGHESDLPWHHDFLNDRSRLRTYLEQTTDAVSEKAFWKAHAIRIYELTGKDGDKTSSDGDSDPKAEIGVLGKNFRDDANDNNVASAVITEETLRDIHKEEKLSDSEVKLKDRHSILHELGHSFRAMHASPDKTIVWAPAGESDENETNLALEFRDESVDAIRSRVCPK